jgi:hypothetical protein
MAECEHVPVKRAAWSSPGLYATCTLCKALAESPGIYECQRCRIFICTICAVEIELRGLIEETLDGEPTTDLETPDERE